ncbi:unnamed protein product [Echinostoma caproni]|uniref:WD_REPEATS_REGION domain-containing protein n=1 Tax=Echinostoma caproni TaxID=27848 RepID=A0A183AM09_9TREM|nr:unnamed protein product [Echinostoma caproni]
MLAQEFNVRVVNEALLPTAVDSYFPDNGSALFVLIGCNRGMLIVWCITKISQSHEYVCKKFEAEEVLTLRWNSFSQSPHHLNFAVGYRKGLIGVYQYRMFSVTSGQVITQLFRFHAHEKDICDLFWRRNTNACGHPKIDLVTTGRDQFVKIWDVESSWCSSSIRVPGSSRVLSKEANRSGRDKNSSIGTPWITCCQAEGESSLWISGLRGEIYHWSIQDTSKTIAKPTASNIHTMLVFALRSIPNSNGLFVSVSQDRQVLVWQSTAPNSLAPVLRIPTVTGGISALSQSEHGNGPIAAGVSDGSLILWRPCTTSHATRAVFGQDLTVLWPRGQNSNGITALAWHPSPQHESFLAYGTEAGCVDLLDTAKPRKVANPQKSKTQPHIFGTTVYRVVWGPRLFSRGSVEDATQNSRDPESIVCCEAVDQVASVSSADVANCDEDSETTGESKSTQNFSFYVYSVCKGRIFCHIGFQRTPLDVTLRFPQPRNTNTDEWAEFKRTDISFLHLNRPRTVKDCVSDLIYDRWDWIIGVGYRDGRVDIYLHRRSTEFRKTDSSKLSALCTLNTHTKSINCLAWSYDSYRLAIGSNEHFITVVDLTQFLLDAIRSPSSTPLVSSTCLARLEGHGNRITCLDWSPHDPALLLSASFDGTANVWSVEVGDSPQNYRSLANFRAHKLRLFSCLWSRTESDLAYSGGELHHLFGWRPSKLVYTEPPNTRRYRPPPVKKVQNASSVDHFLSDDKHSSNISASHPSIELSVCERQISEPMEAGSIAKSINVKKFVSENIGEKTRKRPALFPKFLHRADLQTNMVNYVSVPPLQLSSKLAQVKDIMGTSSDILISATVLVCAGRCREAVDLLMNHNRLKEALLLARLRLDPEDAQTLIKQCLGRMIDRKLTGDVVHLNVIYQLAYGKHGNLGSVLSRSLVSSSETALDALANYWTQFVISARSTDTAARVDLLLQFACACLLVGFDLSNDEDGVECTTTQFFSGWKLLFETMNCSLDVSIVIALLETALLVSTLLYQENYFDVIIPSEFHIPADALLRLDQLVGDRIYQRSHWSTCMLRFVVGLAAVLLSTQPKVENMELSPEKQNTDQFTSIVSPLEDCRKLDPEKSKRLINNLILLFEKLHFNNTTFCASLIALREC